MFNKINNLNELVGILSGGGEILAYGMGEVSGTVLTWLSYRRMISEICCIAVKNKKENPSEFNNLQVYSIDELRIFYSTAKILIFTAEDKQESISRELMDIGCASIYGLSDLACSQIRYELLGLENDVSFRFRWQNELIRKVNENASLVAMESFGICDKNSYAFAEYKNKYCGRSVVIMATGPSMKNYKYIPDAIHIGVNFAFRRKDVPLDFLFIQDGTKIKNDRTLQDEIEKASNKVKRKMFIGKFLARCQCKDIEITEDIFMRLHNARRYFTDVFNPTGDIKYKIFQDICCHPVMDFFSVAFPAIHFALFTNPRKIYLVGCDVTNEGYFDKKEGPNVLQTSIVKLGYLKLKEFVSIYYPNTEVISINPVGLKGLFKDVYID